MALFTPSDNRLLAENEQRGALRPFAVSGGRPSVTHAGREGSRAHSVTHDLPCVTHDLPQKSVMQVICHDLALFPLVATSELWITRGPLAAAEPETVTDDLPAALSVTYGLPGTVTYGLPERQVVTHDLPNRDIWPSIS